MLEPARQHLLDLLAAALGREPDQAGVALEPIDRGLGQPRLDVRIRILEARDHDHRRRQPVGDLAQHVDRALDPRGAGVVLRQRVLDLIDEQD